MDNGLSTIITYRSDVMRARDAFAGIGVLSSIRPLAFVEFDGVAVGLVSLAAS